MKKAILPILLTYIVLILMVFGIYAYKSAEKHPSGTEICNVKKPKEQEEVRLKTAIPLWQSLSRQLIAISK